jgi:putative transposase
MLRRLDKSFRAFFRRLKAGETPGFPRFKGRDRFHSLEYRHGDGCKLREEGGHPRFYVQNVGEIRIKLHRPLPEGAHLGHVILKRSVGKWYVCFSVELPDIEPIPHTGPAVGIDVGLKSLLALSDGTLYDHPRWLRASLGKLRVAQRRLSRRVKGSCRWRKAAFQVARLHERIQHQRLDFWHKATRELVDTFGRIAVEDFSLAFMTHNGHLALSAHDAGLGMFRQLLDYKAESAGSQVVAVHPHNTSQRCSGCSEKVPKSLSVRTHQCPHCGLVEDRDINAAINILQLSLSSLGRSDQALTWPEVRASVA